VFWFGLQSALTHHNHSLASGPIFGVLLTEAQYSLGLCYNKGIGVPKDEAEAVKWYSKAAEQGDAAAQYNLAICYANGTGTPKKAVEAYKWFLLAAAQGDEAHIKGVTVIEKTITFKERVEGQRLAKEWQVEFDKKKEK
jgi:TPR repeat protein